MDHSSVAAAGVSFSAVGAEDCAWAAASMDSALTAVDTDCTWAVAGMDCALPVGFGRGRGETASLLSAGRSVAHNGHGGALLVPPPIPVLSALFISSASTWLAAAPSVFSTAIAVAFASASPAASPVLVIAAFSEGSVVGQPAS